MILPSTLFLILGAITIESAKISPPGSQIRANKKGCFIYCFSIYKPVCGSNDVTYRNICSFSIAKCLRKQKGKGKANRLTIKHRGKCVSCEIKGCPRNYRPVCGSDGKTYSNKCVLKNANCELKPYAKHITVIYKGKCKSTVPDPCKNKACPFIYKPVCGSDGKTYGNKCMLEIANCELKPNTKPITVIYEGKCKPCATKPCTKIYRPVCGSDGKTYGNECMLENANCERDPNTKPIKISHAGKCKSCLIKPCTKMYTPVCGSDGKTYDNQCMLENANCEIDPNTKPITITIIYKGECKSCTTKPCKEIYKPVCGSDGKTYDNECTLENANCERDPSGEPITITHDGECKPTDSCKDIKDTPCIEIYDPICGSNGQTYSNKCYFEKAKCLIGSNDKPLTIDYKGECSLIVIDGCDAIGCIEIYEPICGSDGKTYGNKCELDKANCFIGSDGEKIDIVHKGECGKETTSEPCQTFCTLEYAPVCGSNGITYSNECVLKGNSCESNSVVTKVHDGPCGKNCNAMFCPANYEPVCGTDGKTHSNLCNMGIASCRSEIVGGPAIEKAKDGEC